MSVPVEEELEVAVAQGPKRVDTRKLAMTLVITVTAGLMLWQAGDFPARVALFPRVIAAVVLLLGIVDLVRIVRPAVAPPAGAAADSTATADRLAAEETQAPRATSTAGAIAWFMALVVPVLLVGFLIAVPLYMAASLRLHGGHSWRTVGIAVVSVWLLLYLGFVRVLNLPIYDGFLL